MFLSKAEQLKVNFTLLPKVTKTLDKSCEASDGRHNKMGSKGQQFLSCRKSIKQASITFPLTFYLEAISRLQHSSLNELRRQRSGFWEAEAVRICMWTSIQENGTQRKSSR